MIKLCDLFLVTEMRNIKLNLLESMLHFLKYIFLIRKFSCYCDRNNV